MHASVASTPALTVQRIADFNHKSSPGDGSLNSKPIRETLCESGRCIDALKKRRRVLKNRRRVLKKRAIGFLRRGGGFLRRFV